MQLFKELSRVLPCLFPLALVSCGVSYQTTEVKDYRIAVLTKDRVLKNEFRNLIAEFNRQADRQVLSYEDNAANANSAIIVTKGLENRDGKVGWGQWLSESTEDNPIFHTPGKRLNRRVKYSMRLEFDEDYIRSRLDNSDPQNAIAKQKLFFHEVGHGLEMGHHKDRSDVMYHDISGSKIFENFFARVRRYVDN